MILTIAKCAELTVIAYAAHFALENAEDRGRMEFPRFSLRLAARALRVIVAPARGCK